MTNLKGKINFAGLLMIAVVLYGGFVAYKLISVQYESNQVKKEIFDKLGIARGPDFTIEDAYKYIIEVLVARDIAIQGQKIKVEGEDDPRIAGVTVNSDGSESPTPPTPDPKAEKAHNLAISARFDENKTKIKFNVQYDVEVDLLLFKQKKSFSIEDEVTNVN